MQVGKVGTKRKSQSVPYHLIVWDGEMRFITNIILPPKLWPIPTRGRGIWSRKWLIINKRSRAWSIQEPRIDSLVQWEVLAARCTYNPCWACLHCECHSDSCWRHRPSIWHGYETQKLGLGAHPIVAHTAPVFNRWVYEEQHKVTRALTFGRPTPWVAMKVIASSGTGPSRLGVYCLTWIFKTSSWLTVLPGYSLIWLPGTRCSVMVNFSVDIMKCVFGENKKWPQHQQWKEGDVWKINKVQGFKVPLQDWWAIFSFSSFGPMQAAHGILRGCTLSYILPP